ncbi:MAG: metal-dependent transcriptional regulator [Flavobacteriales bacterium]|nr:metal-dependent transcriptional regulator [Flavobacteriales bacterium]
MQNTQTVEDYLKAIYKLSAIETDGVSTNSLAKSMETKASSVTDMVKKLAQKELANHIKYQGVSLTPKGETIALNIIRKHRLWESFLVNKLNFQWDEIHEIAEQLEHVSSDKLTNKLDKFLGFPKSDPHGDPIPDINGKMHKTRDVRLSDLLKGDQGIITGVLDSSKSFLGFMEENKLKLGSSITVEDLYEFDDSIIVKVNGSQKTTLSKYVSNNLNIKTND